jgi:hypothetical protein
MTYFTHTEDSHHYIDEWKCLLNYIKTKWPPDYAADLGGLEHHIEAKALYVLTTSRHLIEAAEALVQQGNWRPVFVEASLLLFPMLELVGLARLGGEQGQIMSSGIDWLVDPLMFPRPNRTTNDLKTDGDRIGTLGRYMKTLADGPRVRELFHVRNYFTHGLKNQRDTNFDIGAVQTCMNYELPYAIAQQAKVGLVVYWKQLRNVDRKGPTEWVTRLAEADIYPFGIMGSPIYEKGLIDPNIIYWITSLSASVA